MRPSLVACLSLSLLSVAACKGDKSDKNADKAEAGATASQPATMGYWTGAILVPGAPLEWAISIQPDDDGEALAKLWIPAQLVEGVPLGPPKVGEDGSMTVVLRMVDAAWTLVPGESPTCTFIQKGTELACEVRGSDQAALDKLTNPARPQTPKEPFPYAIEELEIPNPAAAGVTLAATLTIPEGEGPHPVVVMITGSGLQDRDETIANHKPFWVIADHLSRNGLAVLRYDDRGFAKSKGDPSKATLEDFASDAWAAAEAVAKRPEIDGERVGLIGHSEGGVIAPLVATQHPEAIDFLVLLAGTGVNGSDLVVHQTGLMLKAAGTDAALVEREEKAARALHDALQNNPPEQAAAALEVVLRAWIEELSEEERAALGDPDKAIEARVATMTNPWFMHFVIWDPAPVLAKVTVPVLLMAGDKDLQVDPDQNLPPMEAALAANDKVTVERFAGLNHMFQTADKGTMDEYASIEETFAPAALDRMTTWLRQVTALPQKD